MIRYRNLGRDSGVSAFEIGEDYIKVQFTSRATYLYTYKSAGAENIEIAKAYALRGKGLNTFINRCMKSLYER